MDMRRNILPGNGRFRIPEQFLLISLCISCVLSLYFYCHYMNRMLVNSHLDKIHKNSNFLDALASLDFKLSVSG